MIFIRRPTTEPALLRRQRLAGLPRALAALNAHGASSLELNEALTACDGGKETLFRAQHRKCAYCERRVGLAANALEHVRPRKEAWRHLPGGSPRVVDPGYWWLTWTWANHLFACTSCNTGYKKSYFPLVTGSIGLAGPTAPYRYRRLRPEHRTSPGSRPPLSIPRWTIRSTTSSGVPSIAPSPSAAGRGPQRT